MNTQKNNARVAKKLALENFWIRGNSKIASLLITFNDNDEQGLYIPL